MGYDAGPERSAWVDFDVLMNRSAPLPKIIRTLQSLRVQTLLLFVIAGVLPFSANAFQLSLADELARNTAAASFGSAFGGMLILRRMSIFPGPSTFAYILPVYSVTFGIAAAILLLSRLDYSGAMLILGFAGTLAYAFVSAVMFEKKGGGRLYVVPGGTADLLHEQSRFQWIPMTRPEVPAKPRAAIVADLHWDHDPAWERMLAEAALKGHPVYHIKQLREALTGRVRIEHLSENIAGTLLPNIAYQKVKRFADVVVCILALPILLIVCAVIGILVRYESEGPAIFRQQRMGYRGKPFIMYKFRTMRVRHVEDCEDARRRDAITHSDDRRITRVGRFLRRSRLDELPQVWNVLLGQMSLIGPRPEAEALGRWYEDELPFYLYRYIVRPGITGWAQINQGHVAELEEVHMKLHYDFFYIKNFSAWLDIVIAMRTVGIMTFGRGWR